MATTGILDLRLLPRCDSPEERDEWERLNDVRHFSTLALQLIRLVSLHSTNEFTWTPPRRMDPDVRFDLFERIAIAINSFGGASVHGKMDGDSVASLYATLQSVGEPNPQLPLSALPLKALDELCNQVWHPSGDDKDAWIDRLCRLARAAAVLGSIPPSHLSAPSSDVPSSWLVWRRDKHVAPGDIIGACRTLGVSVPQVISGSSSGCSIRDILLVPPQDSAFTDSAADSPGVFIVARATSARVREVFQVGCSGAASSDLPLPAREG